jgi:hypothetical protein
VDRAVPPGRPEFANIAREFELHELAVEDGEIRRETRLSGRTYATGRAGALNERFRRCGTPARVRGRNVAPTPDIQSTSTFGTVCGANVVLPFVSDIGSTFAGLDVNTTLVFGGGLGAAGRRSAGLTDGRVVLPCASSDR